MKIQSRQLTHDSEITTGFVTPDFACGDQIDPGGLLQVGMWVHVEQNAIPGTTYVGNSSYTLVQWNEWDSNACSGWNPNP